MMLHLSLRNLHSMHNWQLFSLVCGTKQDDKKKPRNKFNDDAEKQYCHTAAIVNSKKAKGKQRQLQFRQSPTNKMCKFGNAKKRPKLSLVVSFPVFTREALRCVPTVRINARGLNAR